MRNQVALWGRTLVETRGAQLIKKQRSFYTADFITIILAEKWAGNLRVGCKMPGLPTTAKSHPMQYEYW
jgi:hypothetical protein